MSHSMPDHRSVQGDNARVLQYEVLLNVPCCAVLCVEMIRDAADGGYRASSHVICKGSVLNLWLSSAQ